MADKDQILADMADIVNDITGVDQSEVTLEKFFVDDLDVDSLGLLTIATQVEERFGVTLDDSLIPTLPTVGALVDLVTSKKA